MSTSLKRAVGVVRVSRVGDRDGEQFVSPSDQAERIRAACERDGLELVEMSRSSTCPAVPRSTQRPGLRCAVEMVEAGEADVVVVAYFDRLVRSLTVQAEVVGRVEAAGGAILAVDVGAVTTRQRRLEALLADARGGCRVRAPRRPRSGRRRRSVGLSREGSRRSRTSLPAIGAGRTARIELDPAQAAIVAEAFRRRAGGATVMDVREYLRENGIERSVPRHDGAPRVRDRPRRAPLRGAGEPLLASGDRGCRRHGGRAADALPRGRRGEVGTPARTPGRPALRHVRIAHVDRLHRAERQATCFYRCPSGR